jgi:hypothetical protein
MARTSILGADLITHQADCFRTRADKHESAFFNTFSEISIFRKETIAWVDSFRVCHFRCTDNGGNIEVTLRGGGGSDADGFIRQLHVFCIGVSLRMNGNCFDAHFAAGALNAQRNLAAVGYKNFFEHLPAFVMAGFETELETGTVHRITEELSRGLFDHE